MSCLVIFVLTVVSASHYSKRTQYKNWICYFVVEIGVCVALDLTFDIPAIG